MLYDILITNAMQQYQTVRYQMHGAVVGVQYLNTALPGYPKATDIALPKNYKSLEKPFYIQLKRLGRLLKNTTFLSLILLCCFLCYYSIERIINP